MRAGKASRSGTALWPGLALVGDLRLDPALFLTRPTAERIQAAHLLPLVADLGKAFVHALDDLVVESERASALHDGLTQSLDPDLELLEFTRACI